MFKREIRELRDGGFDDLADRIEMYVESLQGKESWLVEQNAKLLHKSTVLYYTLRQLEPYVTDRGAQAIIQSELTHWTEHPRGRQQ